MNTYSQCGEDRIVHFIKNDMRLDKIVYLDVGCYDPVLYNNTMLFYEEGSRGVLVEPNPNHAKAIKERRPQDLLINAAVSDDGTEKEVDLLILSADTLATISPNEASRVTGYGRQSVINRVRTKVLPFNTILQACGRTPDYVSIDIEGIEFEALSTIDFEKYRPKIFCIETRVYTEDKKDVRNTRVDDLMKLKGYMYLAETTINSIYVCKHAWKNR